MHPLTCSRRLCVQEELVQHCCSKGIALTAYSRSPAQPLQLRVAGALGTGRDANCRGVWREPRERANLAPDELPRRRGAY